jgi:hypothetical protein
MNEADAYFKTWRALRRNTIILIGAFLLGYPMTGLWFFVPSARFWVMVLTVPWLLILLASFYLAMSLRCPRCGEKLFPWKGQPKFKGRGICGNCGLTFGAKPASV